MTGLLYVAVIVGGILLGPTAFVVLQLLLAITAMIEFERLSRSRGASVAVMLLDLLGTVVLVSGISLVAEARPWWSFPAQAVVTAAYLTYIVARLVTELYRHDGHPVESLAHSFMGQVYVALPLALMSVMYGSGEGGRMLVLTMFIMIWLNDTGAYCVGSLLGRHRLFPRISPKKSWEGFVGGVVFDLVSAPVFYYCFGGMYHDSVSLWFLLGMGLVVGVMGTLGDLVESMFKREAGVKDSGTILPGHGGILDRIDSLLVVVPSLVVYITCYALF